MTIGSVPSVAPITSVERVASQQQAAFKDAKSEPPAKAPFDPLPALRPTIQDKIEINRTLIALRRI